jgi:hypothetical protein
VRKFQSSLYDQPCRLATTEEIAAHNAGLPHPDVQRARERRRAESVVGRIRALAVGASHLFAQYRRPSQLSAAVASAKDATQGRYTCSRELSLVDGECIGVRVTRTE